MKYSSLLSLFLASAAVAAASTAVFSSSSGPSEEVTPNTDKFLILQMTEDVPQLNRSGFNLPKDKVLEQYCIKLFETAKAAFDKPQQGVEIRVISSLPDIPISIHKDDAVAVTIGTGEISGTAYFFYLDKPRFSGTRLYCVIPYRDKQPHLYVVGDHEEVFYSKRLISILRHGHFDGMMEYLKTELGDESAETDIRSTLELATQGVMHKTTEFGVSPFILEGVVIPGLRVHKKGWIVSMGLSKETLWFSTRIDSIRHINYFYMDADSKPVLYSVAKV